MQPGIIVQETDGDTTVDESGTTDALMVSLTTAPTSNVVFMVTSSNTSEVAVLPTALTFTRTDWFLPQPVTVTGVQDAVLDGDQTSLITFSVIDGSSADEYTPTGYRQRPAGPGH